MENFKMSDPWDIGKDSFPGFRVVAKLSFGFLAWVFMNDWLECSKTSNTMSFLLPEFNSWVLLTYPDHLPLRQVYSFPCVVPNKHWDSRFPETTHFHLITACVSIVYMSFFILSPLLVRVQDPRQTEHNRLFKTYVTRPNRFESNSNIGYFLFPVSISENFRDSLR